MDTIQYYDHKKGTLTHSQEYKVKKILEYGCIKRMNENFYNCGPIAGYNKRTYAIVKREGKWACSCQGYLKRGWCSHAEAVIQHRDRATGELTFDFGGK